MNARTLVYTRWHLVSWANAPTAVSLCARAALCRCSSSGGPPGGEHGHAAAGPALSLPEPARRGRNCAGTRSKPHATLALWPAQRRLPIRPWHCAQLVVGVHQLYEAARGEEEFVKACPCGRGGVAYCVSSPRKPGVSKASQLRDFQGCASVVLAPNTVPGPQCCAGQTGSSDIRCPCSGTQGAGEGCAMHCKVHPCMAEGMILAFSCMATESSARTWCWQRTHDSEAGAAPPA